jgi:hypothetical protein
MTIPGALTKCEATGLPHEIVERNSELICQHCHRPLETCCEGEAGRETPESAAASVIREVEDRATVFGLPIRFDGSLEPGEIRFDHPRGETPELHAEDITPRSQRRGTPAHLIGRVILDRWADRTRP